ncbi:N-alpha-acetyltransferase 30 [Lutzomyia longipalpis]|uniref:N-alpha-acetyltransferase 30 n=1 Tax=Lutzomyia longipalpis TaxID=7200 RepID=UPI002483C07F|nr:N-alpha-acetyltransferase 30 [Lutzomyia longipalpis]
MEVQATEVDLTAHSDGTKKKRPRRRNKSKGSEGVHEGTSETTMDIIRSSATMDELSQKLEERLNLKKNGIYNHRETMGLPSEAEPKDNHMGRRESEIGGECSDRPVEKMHEEAHGENHCKKIEEITVPDVPAASSCCDTVPLATEPTSTDGQEDSSLPTIEYEEYKSELQMPDIMRLIQKDLSEPYSIYTYRYFIHNWPKLCFLAMHGDKCVGAIVCKLGLHRQTIKRGYIAMLAVDKDYRKMKIGTRLVHKAIMAMLNDKADEVVLETEITNTPALRLYENLGFVRDKRLFHYYLSGVDALRLKLWFR